MFYLEEHFDGLGAGGPCSSTGNILSDDPKGTIALPYAVVLRSMDRRENNANAKSNLHFFGPVWIEKVSM